jgi:hypothetical protein
MYLRGDLDHSPVVNDPGLIDASMWERMPWIGTMEEVTRAQREATRER